MNFEKGKKYKVTFECVAHLSTEVEEVAPFLGRVFPVHNRKNFVYEEIVPEVVPFKVGDVVKHNNGSVYLITNEGCVLLRPRNEYGSPPGTTFSEEFDVHFFNANRNPWTLITLAEVDNA